MTGLTVVCVWVQGHVPFTADYVTRLASMAKRRFPKHEFVCLTDRPDRVDVETILIQPPANVFAWWTKLRLFDPELELSGRVVYLDLDVLLVNDMTPIVEFPSKFALCPHAGNFQPKTKHKVVQRFNSSVMVWDADQSLDRLYTDWSPKVAKRLWGDQDWIGEQYKGAETMPLEWFPRLSSTRPPWPSESKVVLCKKPKNAEAAFQWPWFEKEWQ